MNTKWRIFFVSAALFVIIISYKILEPELFRQDQPNFVWDKEPFDEKKVHDELSQDHHRNIFYMQDEDSPSVESSVNVRGVTFHNGTVPKDQVIKAMIDRYTPVYSGDLRAPPWNIAASWVKPRQIHDENAQELGALLHAMATGNITAADVGRKGTQLKLSLVIDHQQKVLFKPGWYTRDYIVTGTPYAGRDRHNAEIAAFHLGRILELRRTPLAIGRTVDLLKEIKPVATETLLKTFFEKDGQTCFFGRCLYCRGPEDGVCAQGGMMEGTAVLWLPDSFKMTLHRHPWSRTYRDVQAKWEVDDTYCELVKKTATYSSGPLLLDMIETSVFDYLIGNADRHHYETFQDHKDSMLIILDNGKSFGNPGADELSILAPLYQCCQIRASLWQRLLALQDGVLSQVLAGVLSHDPIAPVLTPAHLDALDRRLKIVLQQVQNCIEKVGINAIIMDTLHQGR